VYGARLKRQRHQFRDEVSRDGARLPAWPRCRHVRRVTQLLDIRSGPRLANRSVVGGASLSAETGVLSGASFEPTSLYVTCRLCREHRYHIFAIHDPRNVQSAYVRTQRTNRIRCCIGKAWALWFMRAPPPSLLYATPSQAQLKEALQVLKSFRAMGSASRLSGLDHREHVVFPKSLLPRVTCLPALSSDISW
jgi:hypothetical protein